MLQEDAHGTHWSAYWQRTKSLNSFDGGSQAGQYSGPVKMFWQEQFSQCGSRASLLDVGTGNGALAFLAAEYFGDRGSKVSVVAVDAAEIAPQSAVAHDAKLTSLLKSVRFLPKTRVESLPLGSGEFDLVISQFGFEYAQQEAAIREIFRVLHPRGHCVLVVHDRRSAIITDSLLGIEVLTQGLELSGLFPAAKLLLNAIATQASESEVKAAHGAFRTIATELMSRFSSRETRAWFSPLLKALSDLVSLAFSGNSRFAVQLFEEVYASQMSGLRRLREQVSVAFDQERLDRLGLFCSEQGIQVGTKLLTFDGLVFGTALFMQRDV